MENTNTKDKEQDVITSEDDIKSNASEGVDNYSGETISDKTNGSGDVITVPSKTNWQTPLYHHSWEDAVDFNVRKEQSITPESMSFAPTSDYGNSYYDQYAANRGDFEDLNELRAYQQGFLSKTASGITNYAITTTATLLDDTIGLLYGVGQGVYNVSTGKGSFTEGLWNNDFKRGTHDFIKWGQEALPLYRSKYEQNLGPLESIMSYNFLMDQLSNMGYTSGSIAAAALTAGMGAFSKASKLAQFLNKHKTGSKLYHAGASYIHSMGEAAGTAIDSYDEAKNKYINDRKKELEFESKQLEDKIQQELQQYRAILESNRPVIEGQYSIDHSNIDYEMSVAEEKIRAKYKNETDSLISKYNNIESEADQRAKDAATMVYLENVGIIGTSNLIGTFSHLRVPYNNANRNIRGSVTNIFRRKGKEVAEQGWEKYARVGVEMIIEGNEEMLQEAAKEAGINYYDKEFNPDQVAGFQRFLEASGEALTNTYKDPQAYKEFLGGAFIGLFGAAGMRKNNEGKLRFKWTGGIFDTFSKEEREARANSKEAYEDMNNVYNDPNLQKRLKFIIGTMSDKEGMKKALENKDSKAFFDNQDDLLIRTVETFSDLGRLSDLKALVGKEVNMSDEELESFVVSNVEEIKNANGKGTGKFKSDLPLVTATGELKTNTEEGKQEILDYLKSSQDRANKVIDEYEKVINEEDKRTGWSLTRDQLTRLANVKLHADLAGERMNEIWDSMPLKGKYLNTFIKNIKTELNNANISEAAFRERLETLTNALNKYSEEIELDDTQKESKARLATDIENINNLLDIIRQDKEQYQKNITYGENLSNTNVKSKEDKKNIEEDKKNTESKEKQLESEDSIEFTQAIESFLNTLDNSKGEAAAELLAMPVGQNTKTGENIYLADALYDTLQKVEENSDDVVDKINSLLKLRNSRKAYDALFREYIKAPEKIQEDINKTLEKQNTALITYLSNDVLNDLNPKQTSSEIVDIINKKLDKFDDTIKSKVISELENNFGIQEALIAERYKSKMLQYLQEILKDPEKYPNIDTSYINETRQYLENTNLKVQQINYMTMSELLDNISSMFNIDTAVKIADNVQELLKILSNEIQEEKSKEIAARQKQQQETGTTDEVTSNTSQSPAEKQEDSVYREVAESLVKELVNGRKTGSNAEKYAGKSDSEIKKDLIESAKSLVERINDRTDPSNIYPLWIHLNVSDKDKLVEKALKHIGQLNRYKCLFYGDTKMTDIINDTINRMISYINENKLSSTPLPMIQSLSTMSDEDIKSLQTNYPNTKVSVEQSESIPKGTNLIVKSNLDKNEIVILSGNKVVEENPVNTPQTDEEAILGMDPPVTPIIDNQDEKVKTSLETTKKKLDSLRERFNKFVFFEDKTHSYYIYIGDSSKEAQDLAANNDFNNDKFVKADFSASSFRYGPSKVRINYKLALAQEDGNAYDKIIRSFFLGKSVEDVISEVDSASEGTIKQIYDICEKTIKPKLQSKYGNDCVIITDTVEMAAMAKKDDKTGVIAGIPDMIIIDSKGVAHILDFKAVGLKELISTKNPNEYNGKNYYDAYRTQLTVYGAILEANGIPVEHDIQLIQFNTDTFDSEGVRTPNLLGFAPLAWDSEVNISKLDINALRDQKILSAAPSEEDSNLDLIEGEVPNPINTLITVVPVTSKEGTPTSDEVLQQTPEQIVQSEAAKNSGNIKNKQYPDLDDLPSSETKSQTAYLFSDYHEYNKDKEKLGIFEKEVNPYSYYLVQQGAYEYINSDNIKRGDTVYLKPLDVEAVYSALPEDKREQWAKEYKRDVVSPCIGIYHYSKGEYHLVGIESYNSKYTAYDDTGRAMRNRLSLQVLPNDSDLKYGVGDQKDKITSVNDNLRNQRLTQNGHAIGKTSTSLAKTGYYFDNEGSKKYTSVVPTLEKDEYGYFYGKNENGRPLIFGDVLAGKIQTTPVKDDGNYDMYPIRDIKVGNKDFTAALEDGTIKVGVVASANNTVVLSDANGNGELLTDDSCVFAAGSSIVRFKGADGQYKYSAFFGKRVEKADFNDQSLVSNKFLYDTYHQIDGIRADGTPCGLAVELIKVGKGQVEIAEANKNIKTCLEFMLKHTNLTLDKSNIIYEDGKYRLEFKTVNSNNTYIIDCVDNKDEIINSLFSALSNLNARFSLNKGLLLDTPVSSKDAAKKEKNKKWYLKGFLDIAETSVVNFETRNNKVVVTYASKENRQVISPKEFMNSLNTNMQIRTVIHNSLGDIVVTFNKKKRTYNVNDIDGKKINHTELAARLGLNVRDEDKVKLAASIQVFLNKITAFAEYDMNFTSPKYNIYDGKIIFEATPNTMEMIYDAVNGVFITDKTIDEVKNTALQINPVETQQHQISQQNIQESAQASTADGDISLDNTVNRNTENVTIIETEQPENTQLPTEGLFDSKSKGKKKKRIPRDEVSTRTFRFGNLSNPLFNAGVGEYNAINILKGIDSDISRLLQSVLPSTSTIIVLSDKECDEKFGTDIEGAYVTNDNVYVRESAHNDTIIHELVHKVVPSMEQDEDAAEVLKEQFKSYRLYLEVHPELKTKIASKGTFAEYATTDIHEFLAELFSNEEVVKILQSIPSDYTVLNTETSKYEVNPKYRENNEENNTKLLEEANKESIFKKIINSIVKFFTKKAVEKHVILPNNAYDAARKAGEDLIKAFNKVNNIDNREYREINTSNLNKELQEIKDKAIANGTFMKAPNGKPTNLTERQWLQVRTRAFKDWFGDWESESRNSTAVNRVFENTGLGLGKNDPNRFETKEDSIYRITGRSQIDDIIESGYVRPPKGKLRGGRRGEVHWARGDNKLFYTYTEGYILETKKDVNTKVGALSIDDLTAIWQFDGTKWVNIISDIKASVNSTTNSVSKVVDENGEPLVVYHGSPSIGFTTFEIMNEAGIHFGTKEAASGRGFASVPESIRAFFLNIKNIDTNYQDNMWYGRKFINDYIEDGTITQEEGNKWINEARDYVNEMTKDNYDYYGRESMLFNRYVNKKIQELKGSEYGVAYINETEDAGSTSYIVFNPNQVKSATDNIGTFSRENDDIRFEKSSKSEFNNKISNLVNDYNPENSIFVNQNLVKFNEAGKLRDVINIVNKYSSDKTNDSTKTLLKELMPLIRQQDYTKEELEKDLEDFYDTLYGYKHNTFFNNLIDMVNMLNNPMYSLPLLKGSNTNKVSNYRYIENVNNTIADSIEKKC